jgi:hypothetical protein
VRLYSYKLGNTPLKISEDTTLLKTERCLITALKDTLALPITFNERVHGYFMHGSGKLVIDTIIETSRGAIGKPTEKDLTKPFVMFGGTEEVRDKMVEADLSSLNRMGYENLENFQRKAEELCEELLGRKMCWTYDEKRHTRIFLFEIDRGSHDMLISRNAKNLVYISTGKVYVFGDNKSLMTSPNEVLISKPGKSIIIRNENVYVSREL